MNKIVLSALAALTLGTVSVTANDIKQETTNGFLIDFMPKVT